MESKRSKNLKKDMPSSTSAEDQTKRQIEILNESLIEGEQKLFKLSTTVDKIHCRIGTLENSFSEWKKKSSQSTKKIFQMGEEFKKDIERINKLSNLNSTSLDMVLKKEESNSNMYFRGISYIEQETKKTIDNFEIRVEDKLLKLQATLENKHKVADANFLSKIDMLKEESNQKIEISKKESDSNFLRILEEIKLDREAFKANLDALKANQEDLKANQEILKANQEDLKANQEILKANQDTFKATLIKLFQKQSKHSKKLKDLFVEVQSISSHLTVIHSLLRT